MGSHCVYALRHFANAMKVLGTDIDARHAFVDLSIVIKTPINSLAYKTSGQRAGGTVAGRKLGDGDKPVPDIIAEGLIGLANAMFKKLQARRHVSPGTVDESTEDAPQTDGVDGFQLWLDNNLHSQPAPDNAATSSDPLAQGQGLSKADNPPMDVPPGICTMSSGANDDDDNPGETECSGIKSALDKEGGTLPLLTEGDIGLDMGEEVAED